METTYKGYKIKRNGNGAEIYKDSELVGCTFAGLNEDAVEKAKARIDRGVVNLLVQSKIK